MTRNDRLARLLHVLRHGEILAAEVSLRQSRMAPAPWMTRALRVQAAQERGHAAIAGVALQLVGEPAPAPDTTRALRRRLACDLDAGDLAASMVGLQGVVEHLGEALLDALGACHHPAGAVLHALRRKVLMQERGHVQLGARCLHTLALDSNARTPRAAAFDDYRALGVAAAGDVASLLDDGRLDAQAFWRDVDARLARWHVASRPQPS